MELIRRVQFAPHRRSTPIKTDDDSIGCYDSRQLSLIKYSTDDDIDRALRISINHRFRTIYVYIYIRICIGALMRIYHRGLMVLIGFNSVNYIQL